MAINPTTATPLYIQLKLHLQEQIEAGVYAADHRLPSERELAERYGVSRMTARHALQSLQQDGIVYTQIGKGTFVNQPKIDQELSRLSSFTQDMAGRNMAASSRILEASIHYADEVVAAHLGIPVGSEVVNLARIRLADGEPVAIERAHLNHRLFRNILANHDFQTESLYQVLRDRYGVRLAWASQEIEARMPTQEERRYLQLDTRTPILSLARITYDDRNFAVEFVRSCYNSQRYRLTTLLHESDLNHSDRL